MEGWSDIPKALKWIDIEHKKPVCPKEHKCVQINKQN